MRVHLRPVCYALKLTLPHLVPLPSPPSSPGLNLLVGRNGSGKSNFFSAIRFVLSDAYTSMGREEKQALLHDGSTGAGGGATMSAFVEVEFDNQDGRFPTSK